jgi:hypothetical protein
MTYGETGLDPDLERLVGKDNEQYDEKGGTELHGKKLKQQR